MFHLHSIFFLGQAGSRTRRGLYYSAGEFATDPRDEELEPANSRDFVHELNGSDATSVPFFRCTRRHDYATSGK